MDVLFWYIVKGDAKVHYAVHWYSSEHWTRTVLQGTRKTRPCLSGHSVFEKDIIAPDRPANGKLGKNRPIGEKRDQSSKLPFKSGILPTRVSSGAAYRIPVYRKKSPDFTKFRIYRNYYSSV